MLRLNLRSLTTSHFFTMHSCANLTEPSRVLRLNLPNSLVSRP